MAYLTRTQVLELIASQGLARHTRRTITSKAAFLRELELVRKQGFATSNQEHHSGIRSIAAPIYGLSGEVSAGVALNGGLAESAWKDPEALVGLVQAAGREISRRARFR